MNILQILQYIGCALTALVGVYAMLAPKNTVSFTGLAPQGGRGITEIRVVFGVFFIVLGFFPIVTASTIAFHAGLCLPFRWHGTDHFDLCGYIEPFIKLVQRSI